jgi:phosphohistidine phosphatase
MLLHLLRHAHAIAESENPKRPLSTRGLGEVARLGRFLRSTACFRPEQVWHSPLVRSSQTAELIVAHLGLDVAMVETPGLQPDDAPEIIAERLAEFPPGFELALVGHEPHLSALASLLVRDKASPALFELKKCSLLTLEPTRAEHKKSGRPRWKVRWQISPELLLPQVLPVTGGSAGPEINFKTP